MSIKSQGGVFGRNPTFNTVTVESDISISGTLSVGGETITGLSYQGGWNASTNTPDIAASSPVTGQFWIVSADGSTDVGGITNWTSGDWALYDGSNWQRVEGGNTDLTTGVQGQLAVANGGTGAADAATARTNLGLGTAATTASTDYATAAQGSLADSALQSSDIGVSVQGYDANILTSSDIGSTVQGYDAGTLTSADIGSTVQGYDADTAKLDTAQSWSATQTFNRNITAKATTGYSSGFIRAYKYGGTAASPTEVADWPTPIVIVRGYGDYTKESMMSFGYSNDADYQTGNDVWNFRLNGTASATASSSSTNLELIGPGSLVLGAGGASKVTLNSSGNLVMNNGSGIDFSATSGTGTSELLDDYEEGTWTPEIKVNNAGSAIGITAYEATYTKVGRLVFIEFRIGRNDASALSGFVTWNLPFASGNATYFPSGTFWNDNTGLRGFVEVNNYANGICNGRSEAGAKLDFTNYANGQSLCVSLVYQST